MEGSLFGSQRDSMDEMVSTEIFFVIENSIRADLPTSKLTADCFGT